MFCLVEQKVDFEAQLCTSFWDDPTTQRLVNQWLAEFAFPSGKMD
jgi:hypothetical protein